MVIYQKSEPSSEDCICRWKNWTHFLALARTPLPFKTGMTVVDIADEETTSPSLGAWLELKANNESTP
jgi:hypothetical protein